MAGRLGNRSGAARAGRIPVGALLALGMAVAVAGCGFRTEPQPLSSRIPAPQGVRVWTQDAHVVVGWKTVPDRQVQAWEGIVAYRVAIARLPLGCIACAPVEERRVDLPPNSPDLVRDNDVTAYTFTPAGPPSTWEVRVAVDFHAGLGPESPTVRVDAVGAIPTQALNWERVSPETLGTGGKPSIRFFWQARRERVVHVITPGGGQENLDLLFRVNLYRRVPPRPWGVLPINRAPIEGLSWITPEPYVVSAPETKAVEYRLRLVDQQGNEGPASEPVVVPIAAGSGA